ncbi:MAG: SbcC/MukB-like Walker B domain-containing protein [Dermatophilaceae bacterium]
MTTLTTPTTHVFASDEDLLRWREAAVTGCLPTPWRTDRWQVLRAGVVNLWEFEQAEYWYADGWVQLTGRNETGKSSLMALTTLIPWLADTSPANIDTLGDHGKRFRYYVEPTTLDGDRRDANTSTSRGWLWVEYARLSESREPQFFTTLGYAEARRASATITPRWCTCAGSARVRSGMDLVVGRAVQSPAEVAAAVNDTPGSEAFVTHPSAAAYRQHVAERLLGTSVERLDSVGKMLRVARTPKLGQALNPSFVTDKLRDALPGLERGEVEALAVGWDQLDRVRRDLESASANVEAMRAFTTSAWLPYARARLRQSADAAAAARSAFDGVTRRVRESSEALDLAARRVETLDGSITSVDSAVAAAEASREALVRSAAYRDAADRVRQVEQAAKDAEGGRAAATSASANAADASRRADASQQEAQQRAEELAGLEQSRNQAVTVLRAALEAAGLSHACAFVDDADWARLGRSVQDRRTALRHLDGLVRAFGKEDRAAQTAEDQAVTLRAGADDAARRATQTWTEAERARESLAGELAAWIAALDGDDAPQEGLLDRWVERLPVDAAPSTRLDALVRTDWLTPRVAVHERARLAAEQESDRVAADRAGLLAEIADLQRAPAPVVEPPSSWRRRTRPAPGPDGAPLWSLLDPAPGVAADVLARVEAALGAMGLLDAWVTPDGVHVPERDGADALLTVGLRDRADPPAAGGGSLAQVLRVADDPAGGLGGTVAQTLEEIGWCPATLADSPARYAVCATGEWRTPLLAGEAQPLHATAELIGEAARQAARERRIAALQAQVGGLDEALERLAQDVSVAVRSMAALHQSFDRLPSDEPLRRLLVLARDRDEQAARQQATATEAELLAADRRATADRAQARMHEHAAQHGLPVDDRARADLADHVAESSEKLAIARAAHDRHADGSRHAAAAWARHHELAAARNRATSDAHAALIEAERLAALVARLREALDEDVRSVLAQADELQEQARASKAKLQDLRGELLEATGTAARAQAQLESAQQERTEAQGTRDRTFEEFRLLLDAGLADQARLELPEPEARTIEATRDQVAALRSAVHPRDWPTVPHEQASYVARSVQRLTERMDGLRAQLEAGGRTARLNLGADPAEVSVVVDASGTAYRPRVALTRLEETHTRLAASYDESVQRTLHELLGSAFIEHLRDRLTEMQRLVARINTVLARHPTGTTRTSLRIQLTPVAGASAAVLRALQEGQALLDPEVTEQVRAFLRTRIEGAREASQAEGDVEWQQRLADALDYRSWYDVTLEKKTGDGGRWTVLTPATYAHLSGGARVVMLMLPFVATLTALYESMERAPRPFWLDEAFDGLDPTNRATVLELFSEFDLDVLVVGPGRLLNARTVRAAAIYQVVRAEDPLPGADLTVELWAGGELTPLELVEATSSAAERERLPDLFDEPP